MCPTLINGGSLRANVLARLVVGLALLTLSGCELLTDPDADSRRGRPSTSSTPTGSPTFAIDVSFWSGTLAESEVACWWDSGVRHVVTGTQVAGITTQQLQTVVAQGMTVDAYVMLYWDYDITGQVQNALSMIEPFPVQRLWLDAEQPPNGRSASQLIGLIREAEDACGTTPCGIYTRKVWWRDNVADTDAFSHLPIWYAYYNSQDNFDDWYDPLYWYEGDFGGWTDPTGKQYDSDWTAPDLCNVNVDYNVMYTGDAAADFQAELGKVTVGQSGAGEWQSVSLTNTYESPVVIMQPASYNGNQPSTIRVRNVTSNGFEFQIDEWDYLDGAHVTETLGYMVVESGVHTLPSGTTLQAGTRSVDHSFQTVPFGPPFAATPVVLTQAQTYNESSAVVTRQRLTTASGFDVRVQEEEANDGIHAAETIGYLAVEAAADVIAGVSFEAALTADAVTHDWYSVGFAQSYLDPVLLAGLQTTDGGDPAGLRYRSLASGGAEILVEEESSGDAERAHTTEVVGYLVFENPDPGDLTPPAPTGLNPSDDATVTTASVTLTLNSIPGATQYEFEIEYATDAGWQYYYTYFSTEPSRTFWPAFDDTRYRWRVRAQNAVGWGQWSEWATFNFGDVATPPPAPTGLSPDNDETITTSSVTMTCDAISGATQYEFEIEYFSAGSWTYYFTYSASSCSRTFWPTVDDTRYRWRVRAENGQGFGPWSAWATFNFGDV